MRKTTFIVGAVALLAVGALFASNMGFKINYQMLAGTNAASKDGTSTLSLPFNAQTGITDAQALLDDIGSSIVNNIQAHVESDNGLIAWDGSTGTNFAIVPGAGYYVNVGSDTNYIVVGSHDPSLTIALEPGTDPNSKDGTSFISYPYHSTAVDANALYLEIGSNIVNNIQAHVASDNGLIAWDGTTGTNFTLVPGESYFINVGTAKSWTPSHY